MGEDAPPRQIWRETERVMESGGGKDGRREDGDIFGGGSMWSWFHGESCRREPMNDFGGEVALKWSNSRFWGDVAWLVGRGDVAQKDARNLPPNCRGKLLSIS